MISLQLLKVGISVMILTGVSGVITLGLMFSEIIEFGPPPLWIWCGISAGSLLMALGVITLLFGF